VTDKEKLDEITRYVVDMSPIFRPAILLDPESMAYNHGYDTAMHDAQGDLLEILNG
jgi:hypothetical protein